MSRVWARVLPVATSLEACEKAGIPVSHIIAAQGPFTEDVNLAQLKMIDARYIVTKASGNTGGFEEKIRAASECHVIPVIIGQPPQVSGVSLDEAAAELGRIYQLSKREITLIGIGPGNKEMLTLEAQKALENCDAVIGAASVIGALNIRKPSFDEYDPAKVHEVLEAHPSIRNAAIVFRGDTGFFSGATRMIRKLEGERIRVIPGISSLSALSARLGVNWDDAVWISLHGCDGNFINAVEKNKKVFLLTGGENTPSAVCRKLKEYGLGELSCTVGERLSYPDEKITGGSAAELSAGDFDPLSVVLVENPEAAEAIRFGIDDSRFVRGDVPMTKAEVRAISIAKLALHSDSVVWDIGAGTGSVSVECALASYKGQVFAIEKEPDAVELLKCNKLKFKADNLTIVQGCAPDAASRLPAPTHAFIGGSGGNLQSIIKVLLDKNPDVRIVMNTVTLESQAEAFACAKEYGFTDFEAVSVNISRTKKAGSYNLMAAQNPVTVFVMQNRRADG
jgi:precorrin-6Y C5,15-methyltransferase (decarboxylating)